MPKPKAGYATCLYPGCGKELRDSTTNLSAHYRKQHGLTKREADAKYGKNGRAAEAPVAARGVPARRSTGRPRHAPRSAAAVTGDLQLMERAKIIKVDGELGVWLPMNQVFNGDGS